MTWSLCKQPVILIHLGSEYKRELRLSLSPLSSHQSVVFTLTERTRQPRHSTAQAVQVTLLYRHRSLLSLYPISPTNTTMLKFYVKVRQLDGIFQNPTFVKWIVSCVLRCVIKREEKVEDWLSKSFFLDNSLVPSYSCSFLLFLNIYVDMNIRSNLLLNSSSFSSLIVTQMNIE